MMDLSFDLNALAYEEVKLTALGANPRFSVILPLRNHAATVADAIASAQAQSLAEFELIVVDAGADDGSMAIVEAAAALDPRITIIAAKVDSLSAARNAAAAIAKAPLIAFMEGDVIWTKDKLARHFALHRVQPQMAASYARIGVHKGTATLQETSGAAANWRASSLRMVDVLGAYPVRRIGNLVIRQDWFRRVGGLDQTLFYAGDQDLVARVVEAGGLVQGVDATLVARPASMREDTPEAQNIYANWLEIARRYLPQGPQSAELEALCCRTAARHALRMGESPVVALNFIRRGLRLDKSAFMDAPMRTLSLILCTLASFALPSVLRRKIFA
ncbi:glycosyltransferase family 2 protein [Novosphingobium umbonatum]|nr:glycosyltransferase family 2 protein [Novosphingobium umbonatum]